jgi:hypothetical protein
VLEIETDLPPPLRRSSEMRKLTLAILFLVLVSFTSVNSSFATCWVLDGTFYAKNKNDMIKIHATKRVLANYLEPGNHVVYVYLSGIGKVWIYHTSLQCR